MTAVIGPSGSPDYAGAAGQVVSAARPHASPSSVSRLLLWVESGAPAMPLRGSSSPPPRRRPTGCFARCHGMARLLIVWIHMLAAAAWVGGMIAFVALLMPWVRRSTGACADERRAQMRAFGHQFRGFAWVCLVTLLLTGLVLAAPLGFVQSPVRHLLMAKGLLLAVAITLNAFESRIVTRAVARWAGRLSLVIGLVALALAVALVRGW